MEMDETTRLMNVRCGRALAAGEVCYEAAPVLPVLLTTFPIVPTNIQNNKHCRRNEDDSIHITAKPPYKQLYLEPGLT